MKISALLALTGALAASAAPLISAQKSSAFYLRDGATLAKSAVLNPVAVPVWAQLPRWSGDKVSAISLRPAAPASARPLTLRPAGGPR